jgi:hypothetical protein
MDAPIERLDEARGELAKTWLLRVVEQSSLDEIERLPTPRIARELPELIGEIARAAAADEAAGGRGVEWAKRLAELTGRGGSIDSALIRDVASLQSVMITALHKQLRSLDPAAAPSSASRTCSAPCRPTPSRRCCASAPASSSGSAPPTS